VSETQRITRDQFYAAFALAWIEARPSWDVLDTQLAGALAKHLGLESNNVD